MTGVEDTTGTPEGVPEALGTQREGDAAEIETTGVDGLSIMGQWAVEYAREGRSVFVLQPGGKAPLAGSHAYKDASRDLDVVASMWRSVPEGNIGWSIGDDGIVVVDCDIKFEGDDIVDGERNLWDWCERNGVDLPATLTQRTGSGGKQFFFRLPQGVIVQSTNAVLPSVDVKSSGGYVVVAPSLHPCGRHYEWIDQSPIADVPDGLLEVLRSRTGSDDKGKSPISGIDTWDLLDGVPEGRRDDALFALGVRHLKRGDHPAAVHALLMEVQRNSPEGSKPFTREEAEAKYEQALKWVRENPPDLWPDWMPEHERNKEEVDARHQAEVMVELRRLRVREEAQEQIRRERYGRRDGPIVVSSAQDLVEMPNPKWLVDGLLPKVGTFQMYGPSSVGKSFIVQDLLLAVATGGAWLDHFPVKGSGAVVYVPAEGGWDLGVRLRGWVRQRSLHGLPTGFHAIVEQGIDLRSRHDVEEVVEVLGQQEPVAVVFDTWALHMPGGDENSAKDAGMVIDAVKRLAVDLGAIVGTVHHTGHGNTDRARGSSAMRAAWDVEFSFDGRLLVQTKNRYGPKHAPIGVEMVRAYETLVPQRTDALRAVLDERGDLRAQIIDLVRLNEGCGTSLLKEQLGVAAKKVSDAVAELVDDGVLRDSGKGGERSKRILHVVDDEDGQP